MAGYEVTQVILLPERLEHLWGAELEEPEPGSRGDAYVLRVIGWLAGRDQDPSSIEVVYNDRVIRTCPAYGASGDLGPAVADLPPDTARSFIALIGLLGLKLESDLLLRAVLPDGSRIPIATITISRSPLRSAYRPMLRPLMLTGFARGGSTWVMKLLAAHEQIVAYRRFPYESAAAKYWLHMLRVLSEPADHLGSADADRFQSDLGWVGKNPFADASIFEQPALRDRFSRAYVEELAAFCQRAIDQWYQSIAQDQGQAAPVYFAEKHLGPNFIPVLAWELYPEAKEIFLVRDLRDMACSVLAFDERTGPAGFWKPPGMTKEEYLGELRKMAGQLRKSWLSRQDRAHLLRYEDLVLRPTETLRGLLEYLELDTGPAELERLLSIGAESVPVLPGWTHDAELVARHRTTASPESSINRWQREGDDAFREMLQEMFGELLADFGYAESAQTEG